MDDSSTDTGRTDDAPSGTNDASSADTSARRSRGSRGGQGRNGSRDDDRTPEELPEPIREGKVQDRDAAEKALVRKPQIGDTRAPLVPAVPPPGKAVAKSDGEQSGDSTPSGRSGNRRRKRGGKGAGSGASPGRARTDQNERTNGDDGDGDAAAGGQRKRRRGGGAAGPSPAPPSRS